MEWLWVIVGAAVLVALIVARWRRDRRERDELARQDEIDDELGFGAGADVDASLPDPDAWRGDVHLDDDGDAWRA